MLTIRTLFTHGREVGQPITLRDSAPKVVVRAAPDQHPLVHPGPQPVHRQAVAEPNALRQSHPPVRGISASHIGGRTGE
jgi:hypothetical protein